MSLTKSQPEYSLEDLIREISAANSQVLSASAAYHSLIHYLEARQRGETPEMALGVPAPNNTVYADMSDFTLEQLSVLVPVLCQRFLSAMHQGAQQIAAANGEMLQMILGAMGPSSSLEATSPLFSADADADEEGIEEEEDAEGQYGEPEPSRLSAARPGRQPVPPMQLANQPGQRHRP